MRPDKREILVLEKGADAFLKMNAASREWPCFHREQADLERSALGNRGHGKRGGAGRSRRAGKKATPGGFVGHGILPEFRPVLMQAEFWTRCERAGIQSQRAEEANTDPGITVAQSGPCRFAERPENRKHQRLSFEIVSFGLPRRVIDPLPGLGHARHLRLALRAFYKPR